MLASVPSSVPRGETTLNTAGADAPKNSRLEMFSMLEISTAKQFCSDKSNLYHQGVIFTEFYTPWTNGRKRLHVGWEGGAMSGSSMIFVRNVINAQVILFFLTLE